MYSAAQVEKFNVQQCAQAKRAIDAGDATFFRNAGFNFFGMDPSRMGEIFDYALRSDSAAVILKLAKYRECLKTSRNFNGFINKISKYHADKSFLLDILSAGRQNFELSKLRFRSGASVLHVCAEQGNLPWLIYFVEQGNVGRNKECWLDAKGNSPLYYAARRNYLEVAKYLVTVCKLSPFQKNNRKGLFLKTPLDVAKKEVKKYLQRYPDYLAFLTFARGYTPSLPRNVLNQIGHHVMKVAAPIPKQRRLN